MRTSGKEQQGNKFDIEKEFLVTYNARKKDRAKYSKECDNILTFGIETTSGFADEDGNVITYHPYEQDEYWNKRDSLSIAYEWHFSFDDNVYHGRELNEFVQLLDTLPKDTHFIIYVHDLSKEIEYLSNIMMWENVFARAIHSPIYAIPSMFPNIEFRCFYYLTNMSLTDYGKHLGMDRLTIDKNVMRTPNTKLTDGELEYTEQECAIVYNGIIHYRNMFSHIRDIPITQTGIIRRELKNRIRREDKSVFKFAVSLLPKSVNEYKELTSVFRGGYTHANFMFVGRVIRGKGYSYDKASFYPSVVCSEKFPVTHFSNDIYDESKINELAYILDIRFKNMKPKTQNHYIQWAKCKHVVKDSDSWNDSGHVASLKEFTLTITEQDFEIIKKSYTFEYEILSCKSAAKYYLPKTIIDYVLELYAEKTALKGVEERHMDYITKKEQNNAIYGMMVTKPVGSEILFDGKAWTEEKKTDEDIEEYFRDLRENNKGRTFLAYSWGVWVSAYARKLLWDVILKYDSHIMYSDTDAVKSDIKLDLSEFDSTIDEKLKTLCSLYGIDYELTRPKDMHGDIHPLGHFEEEPPFTEFCTIGAKRYAHRDASTNKLHTTISGLSKHACIALKDDISNFNSDMIIDKDYFTAFKDSFVGETPWCNLFRGLTYEDTCGKYNIQDGTSHCIAYLGREHEAHTSVNTYVWNAGKYDEYKSTPENNRYGINTRPVSYSTGDVSFLATVLANRLRMRRQYGVQEVK